MRTAGTNCRRQFLAQIMAVPVPVLTVASRTNRGSESVASWTNDRATPRRLWRAHRYNHTHRYSHTALPEPWWTMVGRHKGCMHPAAVARQHQHTGGQVLMHMLMGCQAVH